jgi:type IV pilus assembly protein PilB
MSKVSETSFFYTLKNKQDKILEGIEEDPLISLVDDVLYNAIESRASDIHFEPTDECMRVRYRIDGILYEQDSISFSQRFLVISRLKILSSLDISQNRLPQDGKLSLCLPLNDKEIESDEFIDLRVATFPSIYGEKMVIRILNRSENFIELNNLGFNNYVLEGVANLIQRPHGFFLVCGPTGSGKTTTLYAILSKLNIRHRNIVTMEDPVEYNIEGITQSQVNKKAGFSFENGMRAILRQDPDVVMIGEVRDKPTAQISIEAALTGHLVLSTLHTNSASGAITRLVDMGVERFLINAALSVVLAQRLVRKLCDKCKYEILLSEDEKKQAAKYGLNLEKTFKAKGCQDCLSLGYKGRVAVGELLLIDDEIRKLLMSGASCEEIESIAIKNGMITLQKDLISKLKKGIISLEEIMSILA